MYRTTHFQRAITWVLIGIYAGLFIAGDGLHLLPGHEHCDHAVEVNSSCPAGCSHATTEMHDHETGRNDSVELTSDGGRCSICELLATRWLASSAIPLAAFHELLCFTASADPVEAWGTPRGLLPIRGPPSFDFS